jgi:hypothetical protein
MASKKGMGFKAAVKATGMPKKQGQAVIAASSRTASSKAKKANPNLKKVAAKKQKVGKKKMPFTGKGFPRSQDSTDQ